MYLRELHHVEVTQTARLVVEPLCCARAAIASLQKELFASAMASGIASVNRIRNIMGLRIW